MRIDGHLGKIVGLETDTTKCTNQVPTKREGSLNMSTNNKRGAKALQEALKNEKGQDRPTVYKGFYIYADQYVRLIELSAQHKVNGIEPSNSSEMIREALDDFFRKYS